MNFGAIMFAAAINVAAPASAAKSSDALQGEWASACTPVRPGSSKGSILRLTVRGTTIALTGQVYATTSCDVPTLKGAFSGTIGRVHKAGDRFELDYVVGDATIMLQRADVVEYYNKVAGCGLSGWQLDLPKSVAGRRCGRLDAPQLGQKMFESAWLSGGKLRLGALPLDTSNRSPGARPATPGTLVLRRVESAAQ